MLSLISCTAVFLKSKRQSLSSCGKAQMNFLANPTVWINLVKALNICYGMNCISPEFYVQALVPCVTVLEMRLLCVCVTVWVCVNRSFLFDSVTPWTLCPPGSSIHGIHQAGVSSDSLLQGIFLTQGSNSGFLHCRQILYHLSPGNHEAFKKC